MILCELYTITPSVRHRKTLTRVKIAFGVTLAIFEVFVWL